MPESEGDSEFNADLKNFRILFRKALVRNWASVHAFTMFVESEIGIELSNNSEGDDDKYGSSRIARLDWRLYRDLIKRDEAFLKALLKLRSKYCTPGDEPYGLYETCLSLQARIDHNRSAMSVWKAKVDSGPKALPLDISGLLLHLFVRAKLLKQGPALQVYLEKGLYRSDQSAAQTAANKIRVQQGSDMELKFQLPDFNQTTGRNWNTRCREILWYTIEGRSRSGVKQRPITLTARHAAEEMLARRPIESNLFVYGLLHEILFKNKTE